MGEGNDDRIHEDSIMKHVSPSFKRTSFNCPHCHVLTHQFWYSLACQQELSPIRPSQAALAMPPSIGDKISVTRGADHPPALPRHYVLNVSISRCMTCSRIAIWIRDRPLYPPTGDAPPVNPDLPEEIREVYDEANSILDKSPRGAAALLRLAIQILCQELGLPGENLNADIKALVEKGLDARVQKALDTVRVVGNNAVHPGQMDLKDDIETAASLFELVNVIADEMFSKDKRIDAMYKSLPENDRKNIEKRDAGSK